MSKFLSPVVERSTSASRQASVPVLPHSVSAFSGRTLYRYSYRSTSKAAPSRIGLWTNATRRLPLPLSNLVSVGSGVLNPNAGFCAVNRRSVSRRSSSESPMVRDWSMAFACAAVISVLTRFVRACRNGAKTCATSSLEAFTSESGNSNICGLSRRLSEMRLRASPSCALPSPALMPLTMHFNDWKLGAVAEMSKCRRLVNLANTADRSSLKPPVRQNNKLMLPDKLRVNMPSRRPAVSSPSTIAVSFARLICVYPRPSVRSCGDWSAMRVPIFSNSVSSSAAVSANRLLPERSNSCSRSSVEVSRWSA